ncbi:soluble quino protein glucose dehydrogenase [Coleophoma cylindrospora]|uniref:Soluble quino protein glucose dehydrogenase n=1 Tax=Coleophoma cylindrospora TaxID=1849047 RepID=A0A3D8QWU8_9HELO|nr:soluble quino protein glucose dehydrogenase [Coleophoma cylindrospora]
MQFRNNTCLGLWALLIATARCQCNGISSLTTSYATPIAGDGWSAALIANGLSGARSILFDSNGALLVVRSGTGIVHLTFTDGGGTCLEVANTTYLVNSTTLNHGIALSADGNTLYASSSEAVYSWAYDPAAVTVSGTNKTLISGMSNDDHTTRTLLMSQKQPGTLIVSRGSNSNIDVEAESLSSGHSQIRAFNVDNVTDTPYEFTTSGRLLGWGLRNSVGVAEEPLTGGIYSVENSADEIQRNGTDIHQNNPGEEMNFHGTLSSTDNQGGNYGYPNCFAVWNTSIPDAGSLTVGSQMTIDATGNASITDAYCASTAVSPRLTFQAHMAPLDIIFLPNGTEAYVTFHGSWDRTAPVGYKVAAIAFNNGQPVAASDSLTATTDIFVNTDNANCPDSCFRPVGLALDQKQRLFMSSDATGEIYVLAKTGASSGAATGTGSAPSPTATHSAAARWELGGMMWLLTVLVIVGSL